MMILNEVENEVESDVEMKQKVMQKTTPFLTNKVEEKLVVFVFYDAEKLLSRKP